AAGGCRCPSRQERQKCVYPPGLARLRPSLFVHRTASRVPGGLDISGAGLGKRPAVLTYPGNPNASAGIAILGIEPRGDQQTPLSLSLFGAIIGLRETSEPGTSALGDGGGMGIAAGGRLGDWGRRENTNNNWTSPGSQGEEPSSIKDGFSPLC